MQRPRKGNLSDLLWRRDCRRGWDIHQCENASLLRVVSERAEIPNLFQPAHAVNRIEKACVTGGQLGRFQVAAAQILILKRPGVLGLEKMETQPAAIGAGDPLRLAKKGHEQEQDKVGVDPRLELEIARKILRGDPALAAPELERGV